ncbi:MAG: hypothetical protein OXH76_16715 [Boseongicola sp.]|nr:hypothetical protein [Boseongicola sp.]
MTRTTRVASVAAGIPGSVGGKTGRRIRAGAAIGEERAGSRPGIHETWGSWRLARISASATLPGASHEFADIGVDDRSVGAERDLAKLGYALAVVAARVIQGLLMPGAP